MEELPDDFRANVHKGQRVRLGTGLEAVVKDVSENRVTLDANLPLAGKTLNFDVEVLELIKAGHSNSKQSLKP